MARGHALAAVERMQSNPAWKDHVLFLEYFHGDSAAGLGASHQTGWTGIVADIIRRRQGATPNLVEMLAPVQDGVPVMPAGTPVSVG